MSEGKVVQAIEDAVNGGTVNVAAGTVERILIKRLNEDGSPNHILAKSGPNKGKTFPITHKQALRIKSGDDEVWIGLGDTEIKNLKYENQFQIKEDDKYVDLKPGMKVRIPGIDIRTYEKDGKAQVSYSAKRNKIRITDKSGAREDSPQTNAGASQTSSGASNAQGGKTTKVFGEILSTEGLHVLVKTEQGTEVDITLTKEQFDQIQVGGRLAGQIDGAGNIVSGFKPYGPKGTASRSTSGSGKRDNSGVETGHALNGALNLRRSGLTLPPVVEIAKVVHDVTKFLKQEASQDPSNKGMSDYDLGAMVGHAVLNATRDISVGDNDNPEEITGKLLAYSRELMVAVVPGVASYVKGENLTATASAQEDPKLEPKTEDDQKVNDNGHIDMSPPDIDFDDDIPF